MHARVLMVGDVTLSGASLVARLRRALERAGHAVQVVSGGCGAVEPIRAARRGFGPSVVLADPRVLSPEDREAIEGLGVPTLSVGGRDDAWPEALCAAARDEGYRAARTSLPVPRRDCSCALAQRRDAERERVADELAAAGLRVEVLDSSWGARYVDALEREPGFALRTSSVFLALDGDDAPTPLELALRAHEGCALVVEKDLAARLGDAALARAVTVAERADVAAAARGLALDPAARAEALSRQEAWLDALPGIDEACAAALARADAAAGGTVLRQDRPVRRVVAYGWFGMENFGDDLLLRIVVDHVRARLPESEVCVIAGDPVRVRAQYGLETVRAGDVAATRDLLRGASALVFCGGLIFDDTMAHTPDDIELFLEPYMDPACQADACLMAWQCGVPAYYLGAGVGPAANPATRACLRYIGLSGARLLLRDADSVRLALDAGVPAGQVEACCDLALAARASVTAGAAAGTLPEGLEPGRYVTVALRAWPLNPSGFEDALAAELDRIAEASGLTVAFVPFDPEDAQIHEAVASRMRLRDRVVQVGARLPMEDMFAVIDGSALAVAMRLHCSILHHVLGKPAVGLDYNEKVGSHFREVGRAGCLVALDEVAGRVSEAALAALSDPDATRAQVERGVARLAPKADAAFAELFSAIEAHEPRPEEPEVFHPRSCSQTVVELRATLARERELAARADALEAELAAARQRIRDLEESTSYRLGNALVKVPRALLRRD